ncbi:DoxX family protein [Chitinophaga defluvii]|uniref:DoxX family protein n=1 Tax=Chitinophaga defluvii TaxID=3163343 RepID=A0ABV2T6R3_9BACT
MRKLFSAKYTSWSVSLSMLVLRLVMGGMMLTHGWPKLINFPSRVNSFSDPLHVGKTASLGMVVFAEVFCSVFIILGLLTRLASVPLIICMSVVIFMIHAGDPVNKIELPALFLASFVAILFTGPGRVSIDGLLSK